MTDNRKEMIKRLTSVIKTVAEIGSRLEYAAEKPDDGTRLLEGADVLVDIVGILCDEDNLANKDIGYKPPPWTTTPGPGPAPESPFGPNVILCNSKTTMTDTSVDGNTK